MAMPAVRNGMSSDERRELIELRRRNRVLEMRSNPQSPRVPTSRGRTPSQIGFGSSRSSLLTGSTSRVACRLLKGSRGAYGGPGVHAELRLGRGMRVGRKRVAQLMRIVDVTWICHRRNCRHRPAPPRTRRTGCGAPTSPSTRPATLVRRRARCVQPPARWAASPARSTE
jgi:hypothetical protein